MYHHSDLKKFLYCPRLFWCSSREERTPYQHFIRMDASMTECLIEKLGIKEPYIARRGVEVNEVLVAMQDHEWILKGRFEAAGLRIKLPAIHKTPDGWDVYFTYMGLLPKADDVRYYANHMWVLRELAIQTNNIYIVHFNSHYSRNEQLNINDCLSVSDSFYKTGGKLYANITKKVSERMSNLIPPLTEMANVDEREDYPITLAECPHTTRCDHYTKCFFDEDELPVNSIVYLTQSANRQRMIEAGVKYLHDAPLEQLEGTRIQFAQIMADRLGGLFFDKHAVSYWLSQIKTGPISFLDFEWDTFAIPPYSGMHPFDVLPFQYSLHVVDGSNLIHHEFLGSADCRREFIETLLENIPAEGTVFAYNAYGAETLRLKELIIQFPEFEVRLNQLIDRMNDMAAPFINGLIYDVRMRGSFSLKTLLSVVNPDMSYQQLEIHHGMDAVRQYREMEESEDEDDLVTRSHLLAYCSLDTYSMVEVYRWMLEKCE